MKTRVWQAFSLHRQANVQNAEFFVSNAVDHVRLDRDWSSLNDDYHVAFLQADCTFVANAASLSCVKGDLMVNSYNEAFYRTRKVDDLGTIRDITSQFPVQRLEIAASPDGFALRKLYRNPGTGEIVTQTISIGSEQLPLSCNDNGEQFVPHVAPALVDHLELRQQDQ